MKKLLLSFIVMLFVTVSFAQKEKKNGTIYINHPYIDIVNKASKAYVNQDLNLWKTYYSDTAKFWVSDINSGKWFPLTESITGLALDYKFYDNVKSTQVGYPDYLQYDKDNSRIVQSWWLWSGISKKTGKELKIYMVQFDTFNTAGKIVKEETYADFSKQMAEEGTSQYNN
ncbi:MAG: hypothetical protein WCG90_03435 [Chitinophagia bacterium]|jgi:hypothetical protein